MRLARMSQDGCVRHPPAGEHALLGLAGRPEARDAGNPAEHPEGLPPVGLAAAVDGLHQTVRHVPPNRGLPEGPGAGDEGGHQRDRVPHRLALAEAAGERGHVPAAVSEHLHGAGAHAHQRLAVVPCGAGAV